jgi:hypothetical protein
MYYVIRDRDNPQFESWLIAPFSKSPRLYLRNEYEGSWIHGDVFEDFPTEPMQFLLLSDEKIGLIITTDRLTLIHETLCQFLEVHADGEFYSHRIEILEPKTKRIVTNEYFFVKPYKKS